MMGRKSAPGDQPSSVVDYRSDIQQSWKTPDVRLILLLQAGPVFIVRFGALGSESGGFPCNSAVLRSYVGYPCQLVS